jgi:hypothetical protein
VNVGHQEAEVVVEDLNEPAAGEEAYGGIGISDHGESATVKQHDVLVEARQVRVDFAEQCGVVDELLDGLLVVFGRRDILDRLMLDGLELFLGLEEKIIEK